MYDVDAPSAMSPTAQRPKVDPEKIAGPRAVPPVISEPSGVFRDEVTISIKAAGPAAQVRYTLDGADPTAASPAYAGPLTFSRTTLVKAKAFEPDQAPSPTVTRTYTILDENLGNFSSNLPLVIINAFGQQIRKETEATVSLRVVDSGSDRISLTDGAGFDGPCDIKFRGYSSLRFPKRSFTIKLQDGNGQRQEETLLGMPKDSHWVLYAPYSDKTLMRDVLAYELSNRMGRYAARTRFVEVFLNRNSDKLSKRDYMGVYVLEEKIKRSPDRVNIAKLTPDDQNEPNISGGYIFKRDHSNPPMDAPYRAFDEGNGFRTSRGVHLFFVDPEESELTPAQRSYLARYVSQFERALYGPDFRSPSEGYAKYLDVDSFIDQFWIVELSKNVDGFRYSCYMTKDRGGKIRMEPIWDWNLSFGNANYHQGWMPERWYWRLLRENEISWYRRLSQDPDFVQRLTDRWTELRKSVFEPEFLVSRIDQIAEQLAEAQKRNFQRWPILGQSVNPNWFVGDSFQDEVSWMKHWIRERIAWIDSQFLAPPSFLQGEESLKAGRTIRLETAAGEIFFTLDGSDPRLPGGEVSARARPYREPFVLEPGTQLFARVRGEDGWSGPLLSSALEPARRGTHPGEAVQGPYSRETSSSF